MVTVYMQISTIITSPVKGGSYANALTQHCGWWKSRTPCSIKSLIYEPMFSGVMHLKPCALPVFNHFVLPVLLTLKLTSAFTHVCRLAGRGESLCVA